MSVRTLAITFLSTAMLLASCSGGDSNSSGGADNATAAATPLQALLECDPARVESAASGMRLAAEYGNGKFYLPNEPIQAFGMPVVALLIYNERYSFGMPMGENANVIVDAPRGIYTVTFVDAPGANASRAVQSWASSHGYNSSAMSTNADEELNAVAWAESSAIQSVTIDSLPADVGGFLRRVGDGVVTPLSLFVRGGEGQSDPAHTLWVEATETGEISAVHCPGNNLTGLF